MSNNFNPKDFLVETSKSGGCGSTPFPIPEEGSQLGVVNLIVDMGVQEREDFEDPQTGETKSREPVNQFAVFFDLPESIVDYGGKIGEKPYRLRAFHNFKGNVVGWSFAACPPMDTSGKFLKDGMRTFHPNSPFRKLAKATGNTQIFTTVEDNMDIRQLLGSMCLVDVELKEWSKGDKSGTDVKYRGVSKLKDSYIEKIFPEGLPEMQKPRIITFENVGSDDVKFIHRDVIESIKQASNYEGSVIQQVFVETGHDSDTGVENQLSANEPTNIGPSYSPDDEADIPF